MTIYIHRLETSVPETHYEQSYACELMQRNVSERDAVKRVLRSIYHNSGIRKRHSVITDFSGSADPPLFFNPDGTRPDTPGTRRRNDIYAREARRHFTDLGKKLLRNTPGIRKEDVTHLVTVSCTGFFAPGPDYFVVRDLGLDTSTERYHIGFMGCYAAFQGLKMAHSFCMNNPDAVVLVLCVELCTLHLQFSDDTDAMISASVFADGGSGALVSARRPAAAAPSDGIMPPGQTEDTMPSGQPSGTIPAHLEMQSFHSDLTPEGEGDMAWTIGNHGFEMRLSTYVPEIIRSHIGPALDTILRKAGLTRRGISRWAVHPGGRAILDKVQEALELDDEQIAASRTILREYGNMSSATILFVLKELVDAHHAPDPQTVFGMAFGPGLTIETGLFRLVSP